MWLARVRVLGHRVNKDGGISTIPHDLMFHRSSLPDWAKEILGG